MTQTQAFAIIQRRPIESLKFHPDNPRLGDVDAIKESIRVNGWHGSVVMQQSSGYLIAGNHRTEAALELHHGNFNPWPDQSNDAFEKEKARWHAELTSLPVHVVDCDDETAIRIMLADNKTADRATYDENKLLRLHAQILDPETAAQVLMDPNSNPDEVQEALRMIAQRTKNPRLRGTGYSTDEVEQLAFSMEGGRPREWGSEGTAADAKERYDTGASRQWVIPVTADEYDRIMPVLIKIMNDHNLDSLSDTWLWLLEEWQKGQPSDG